MMKNIVVCADGTGNTFARRHTNVSRLIRCLDLSSVDNQVAFYDQGIGTHPDLASSARDYKTRLGSHAKGLTVLDPPAWPTWMPPFVAKTAGLVSGYGLEQNVSQIVHAIWKCYEHGDRIYLFGFSRGAFTVRAVAGLIYHCGFPKEHVDYRAWFAEAFGLYKEGVDRRDARRVAFRDRHSRKEDVRIEFLGLWDTVKAYGVVWPKSLLHLRHNPLVKTVRHALALHETRSWFVHTTWGSLREKITGQQVEPDERYASQTVVEEWFPGSHADVGGGDKEWATAQIPFRWMLNEAHVHGLRLTPRGRALLCLPKKPRQRNPVRHESFNFGYWLSGVVPRFVLHNDHRPARRQFSWFQPRTIRDPGQSPRYERDGG